MSQKPIEALGESLRQTRESLEPVIEWYDTIFAYVHDRKDEDHDAHAIFRDLSKLFEALGNIIPSPESLATLARHAEIGEMLQQLQVAEPWFTLRYESVPGSSRVQTRVATPRGAFKADLFTDALRAALATAPKEPTE